MTEYELGEVISNAASNGMTAFTVWLSIASGYLLLAYSAGSNLTTIQASIISVLYVVCSAIFSALTMIFCFRASLLAGMKSTLFPDSVLPLGYSQSITDAVLMGLAMILLGGILASLYFMWTIRNPKVE